MSEQKAGNYELVVKRYDCTPYQYQAVIRAEGQPSDKIPLLAGSCKYSRLDAIQDLMVSATKHKFSLALVNQLPIVREDVGY